MAPQPSLGLSVQVNDQNGNPLSGAVAEIIEGDGTRLSANSDGNGLAFIQNVPDGTYTVYIYQANYFPTTTNATISGGVGSVTATLTQGSLVQTSLTSTPLTEPQIIAAGIDPNDPANQNIYKFTINLYFGPTPITLSGYTSSTGGGGGGEGAGFVGGTTYTAGGGGGGGGACSGTCPIPLGGGTMAIASVGYPGGEPELMWLIIPGQAEFLKEFFNVQLVVSNLANSAFTLSDVHATLSVPGGMSLAPTAVPQSVSATLPNIPGGQSESTSWILRGDQEGYYDLSADISALLQPLGISVAMEADSTSPLHVWGGSAVSMTVNVDDSESQGYPYHVSIGLTNVSDIPVYNVSAQLLTQGMVNYIYQPDQQLTYTDAELDPGQTFWTPDYILVPTIPSTDVPNPLNLGQSFVAQTAGNVSLQSTIIDHPAVDPPSIAPTISASPTSGDVVLNWQPVSGASEYEIFGTPSDTTPFPADPIMTVDGSQTSAIVPNDNTNEATYYAVSSVINGVPTMEHPLVSSLPNCSMASLINVKACLRIANDWWTGLADPANRAPDFVIVTAGAGVGKVGINAGIAISCDGNEYATAGISVGFGIPASAVIGFGWIYNRTSSQEPNEQDVDSLLSSGHSFGFTAGLGIGADFGTDGSFVEWFGADAEVSAGLSFTQQIGTQYTPNGTCNTEGSTQSSTFQDLIDTPIAAAATGVPILRVAAASALGPVLGPTATIYVAANGFRLGSDVIAEAHSTGYDLGTFSTDDQGNFGNNFTLPNLPPGQHSITITGQAPDGSQLVETFPFVVSDGPPITQTGVVEDSIPPGTAYTSQLATAGGSGTVTYAQTSGTPQISVSSSGAISAPATLLPGVYSASGTDSDVAGDAGTWSFTLAVSASPLTSTAGSGTTNTITPLSGQLSTTGGVGPYTYVQTSGSPDLMATSQGAIASRSPLSVGTYAAQGTVTDSAGDFGAWSFTLAVSPSPISTNPTSASTSAGTAYSGQLSTSGGSGTVSYTESAGAPQIVVNSNGTISAPATLTPGTYGASGTDSDSVGDSGKWTLTLTVTAPLPPSCNPPVVTSANVATATVGTPFSFTVTTCTNAVPTIKGSGLPKGLTLVDQRNGTALIQGTPAVNDHASYSGTIMAAVRGEVAASQSFTVTVDQLAVFKSKAKTVVTAGQPITEPFEVLTKLGNPEPALTATGLPQGMMLLDNGNGTGEFVGTPEATTGGLYTVTISASNVVGTLQQTFALYDYQLPTFGSVPASETVTKGTPITPITVSYFGYPIPSVKASGLSKGFVATIDTTTQTVTISGHTYRQGRERYQYALGQVQSWDGGDVDSFHRYLDSATASLNGCSLSPVWSKVRRQNRSLRLRATSQSRSQRRLRRGTRTNGVGTDPNLQNALFNAAAAAPLEPRDADRFHSGDLSQLHPNNWVPGRPTHPIWGSRRTSEIGTPRDTSGRNEIRQTFLRMLRGAMPPFLTDWSYTPGRALAQARDAPATEGRSNFAELVAVGDLN